MSLFRNRVSAFGLSFLVAFAGGSAARADQAVTPLSELLGKADYILVGRVADVSGGEDFLLTVDVEETLKGAPFSRFVLRGSDRNSDSFPRLPKGTQVLAFLTHGAPGLLQPIGGEQSVLVLGDGSVRDVAREIVLRGLKFSDRLGLDDFEDLLRSDFPSPPALLGALTEELSRRVTDKDTPLLGEIVCDRGDAFLPAVQLWAISEVGPLGIADARPCLEEYLVDPKQQNRAIAASEALGELRDPASVDALLGLLGSLPADERLFGRDRRGDSTVANGRTDPEDEQKVSPDPDESSARGDLEILSPPAKDEGGDGDTEPDNAPSEDRPVRGAGGGLAEATILALGKIGDPSAVPLLVRIARQGDDLSLHSTAINALGLIGGRTVLNPLLALSRTHPNPLVRQQAQETLERLQKELGGVR